MKVIWRAIERFFTKPCTSQSFDWAGHACRYPRWWHLPPHKCCACEKEWWTL